MAATRYSDAGVSPRTNVYVVVQMLRHATPVIVLDKTGGVVTNMPPNRTQTAKWRRPVPFNAVTTPLPEYANPTPTTFRYEDVEATLQVYAELTQVSDVIEDTHEDPVLQHQAQAVGENVGRSTEQLNYGILRAGTNVFYANGTARTDVNTAVSVTKLRAVTRYLDRQKALRPTNILDSSPDYATFAIEASYIAVCHTDLKSDIRNLAGFTPLAKYGSRRSISSYEFGDVEDVRFLASPDLDAWADGGGTAGSMVSTGGSNADVYPILVFGKEAWATVGLRGRGMIEPTIIRPGTRDKSDPLGRVGYVGAKWWWAAAILNQRWMARLEVAATAL